MPPPAYHLLSRTGEIPQLPCRESDLLLSQLHLLNNNYEIMHLETVNCFSCVATCHKPPIFFFFIYYGKRVCSTLEFFILSLKLGPRLDSNPGSTEYESNTLGTSPLLPSLCFFECLYILTEYKRDGGN